MKGKIPQSPQPHLSRRDVRFIEQYISNGGNAVKALAAISNGKYDLSDPAQYNRCQALSSHLLKKLKISLPQEMAAMQITKKFLAQVLKDGLTECTRTIFNEEDQVIRKERDLGIVHKYLDTALKILNEYPPQDLQINLDIEAKTGVVIVPGVVSESDWEKQMTEHRESFDQLNNELFDKEQNKK